MNPMKRLGMAALLVLVAGLGVASFVLAKPVAGLTYPLVPPADSPEPQATGWVHVRFNNAELSTGTVGVTCAKLTPRARYTVVCYNYDSNGEHYTERSVAADRNGDLGVVSFRISWDSNSGFYVGVQNKDGVVVLQ